MTPEEIQYKITQLHFDNQSAYSTRGRIRAIMNGGPDGLLALLGDQIKGFQDFQIPVPNLMMSGLEHLSQKIGRIPNLKVDVPNNKDSERARAKADKIARIVTSYDDTQKLDLQMPQVGRWLPGYGFAVWVIREKKGPDGTPYPCAELRDPYNCFPGYFGADQQPKEMAIIRRVPKNALSKAYPNSADKINSKSFYQANTLGVGNAYASAYTDSYNGSWANSNGEGDLIAEYYNEEGTYIFHMTSATILDFIPNPLDSGPAFVVAKKFAFDRLQGQYDQIIGLMASMAKINVMSIIAMEDAVFTETNISGEIESGQYRKGRFAVNYLAPGTQVSKPANNIPYQLFQQVDRLERQLRLVGGYPVTDDAQSPASVATGAGLAELNSSMSLMINEYREIIKVGVSEMDNKRLELDEIITLETGAESKPMAGYFNGTSFSENYKPLSDIGGDHKTRRIYGVMAGFDEPQKIVTGLQLLQAGVIDVETLQDNIDGLENIAKVQERIRKNKAETVLFDSVLSRSAQGDAAATMAVIAIYENPYAMTEILKQFYTPEEPQLSPEQMAMIEQQQMAQAMPQQTPSIQEAFGLV